MKTTQIPRNNFAAGLRKTRDAQGLSQEDFGLVSSRTYVSSLERGLKSPTLNKVDDLANTLGVHPLTLLVVSYVDDYGKGPVMDLLDRIREELLTVTLRK
jgi:transcriptional regulator with XRE-family HTH domain